MKQMKRMKWLALLVSLAMIAVACGGDGGDDVAADGGGDDTAETDGGSALVTDVGVTDDTIRVGLLTDLTGIFAGLTVPIADGTEAYFERLNDEGGIAGRQIEVVVRDTSYDVPTHQEFYDTLSSDGDEGVAIIGTSVGSPHTASIREDLVADELGAIPLSWNSSWAAPESSNVFEFLANYCVEAINGVSYLADVHDAETIAIVGFPGDYGEDGSIGAKEAAEELGLDVVFDGQAMVVPGADQTPVITGIVESGADIVWATTNPSTLGELMGGAAAAGFTGQWGGNGPSFNPALLDTELAPLLDANYTHFSPNAALGQGGAAGMDDVVALMEEYRPDAPYLSVYVISWVMGEIVRQGLEAAAENGDLTRAGIVSAIQSTEIDLGGIGPDIDYSGEPNDAIARETFIFDVVAADRNAAAVITDGSGEGLVEIEAGFVSDIARDFEYRPCFGI